MVADTYMYPTLILQRGKEANVGFRHPWIFSGALVDRPDLPNGELVRVVDQHQKVLGTGTYSTKSSIAVRVLEFGEAEINGIWFVNRFREADKRRALCHYGSQTDTTAYRVIFGEADGVPGLVVDRYGGVFVIQISTAGMDALRDVILDALAQVFKPQAIIERSDLPVRREEGLAESVSVLSGQEPGLVEFAEHGLKFVADPLKGQKTGFFLDQKDLRRAIRGLAAGRSVLNIFSYTGAAGVAALAGGAKEVLNVDSSADALALCAKQAGLNGLDAAKMKTAEEDAFQFLGALQEPAYDMVLLDPPAIIKARRDEEEGKKAYHFLNRAALRNVKDGGIFVTSSCSHFFSEEDFAFTLRRASVQAGVQLSLLGTVRQSADHPLSVYFPEGLYLKSFICHVRR